MIYANNRSVAIQIATAQALAAKILAKNEGGGFAYAFGFGFGSGITGGDPALSILLALNIRDVDIVFAQRECTAKDSITLMNMMAFMSLDSRARVVLPDGTEEEIRNLLAQQGERV